MVAGGTRGGRRTRLASQRSAAPALPDGVSASWLLDDFRPAAPADVWVQPVPRRVRNPSGFGVDEAFQLSALQRGQTYARTGKVLTLDWSRWKPRANALRLDGLVDGTAENAYRTTAVLEREGTDWVVRGGWCSCPVTLDCKHAVALGYAYLIENGLRGTTKRLEERGRPRVGEMARVARPAAGGNFEVEFVVPPDALDGNIGYEAEFRIPQKCQPCGGSAEVPWVRCDYCDGTGIWNGLGAFPESWSPNQRCLRCSGLGRWDSGEPQTCRRCRGTGQSLVRKLVEFDVPLNAKDGTRVSVPLSSGNRVSLEVILRVPFPRTAPAPPRPRSAAASRE